MTFLVFSSHTVKPLHLCAAPHCDEAKGSVYLMNYKWTAIYGACDWQNLSRYSYHWFLLYSKHL